MADVDRFNDVWNQPVVAYESTLHEELPVTATDFKNGINKRIRVVTSMSYGDELEFYSPEFEAEGIIGFVSKEPVTGTPAGCPWCKPALAASICICFAHRYPPRRVTGSAPQYWPCP